MLPVKWVSFDQFQSTDSQQILAVNGFVTGYQSMDTDTHAYDMTKQAFYDERIIAPAHAKAQHELLHAGVRRQGRRRSTIRRRARRTWPTRSPAWCSA